MEDDLDAAFALATSLRRTAAPSPASIVADVEQRLRALYFSTNHIYTKASSSQRCSSRCRSKAIVGVVLLAGSTDAPLADVHVCFAGAACGVFHDVNARVWSTKYSQAFYCIDHTRVHVCTPSTCTLGTAETLGGSTCALSGYHLHSNTADVEYGNGVHVVNGLLARLVEDNETDRRQHVADAMIAQPNVAQSLVNAKKRALDDDDDDDERYVDLDLPISNDIFPLDEEDNTFGNNATRVLITEWYCEAYFAIRTIFMSDDRARLETRIRIACATRRKQQLAAYVRDALATGAFIDWLTLLEIDQRSRNEFVVSDTLVLPAHGRARLTAYYALRVMEFHFMIIECLGEAARKMRKAERTSVERYGSVLTFGLVVPSIVSLFEHGLVVNDTTVFAADDFGSLVPSAQMLRSLGYKAKTHTRTLNTINKVVRHTTSPLVSTTLSMHDVLFKSASVVSLFLAARRARLLKQQ